MGICLVAGIKEKRNNQVYVVKGFYYIYNINPDYYTLHIKQKLQSIDVHAIDKKQQQFQEIDRFIL